MFMHFSAGHAGPWQIVRCDPVSGEGLAPTPRLSITPAGHVAAEPDVGWQLTAFASNVRYVERAEKTALTKAQAGLGRSEATCAALIPIRKNAAWWDMTQDERRHIFEAQSHHIADSMKYLPAIARQLYHCRDLGQPFDFLTWFEFAPAHASEFEHLVAHLRGTPEWSYVEREVDIRLMRD